MSLDGPPVGMTQGEKARVLVNSALESLSGSRFGLGGFFDPFTAHPWLLLLGVVGGAWVAGKRRKR